MFLFSLTMRAFQYVLCAILLVKSTHGTGSPMRPYSKLMLCGDGNAHDILFPNDFNFSCKRGPGNFPKCKSLWFSINKSVDCPKYGYVSGWHLIGNKVMIRCCNEPGLFYSPKNCRNHYNKDVVKGRSYRVDKGKFITGFKTFDGGVTWFNKECRYSSTPKPRFPALY